jgi:nucleoside-diphosphate-sugar epimerase
MQFNSSILVLGAGELGMAVLRGLAAQRGRKLEPKLAVLLRPETVRSTDIHKRHTIAEVREADIELVSGDLQHDSADELASIFQPFETVIGCTGFAAGKSTQLKIAQAALQAGVKRYVPWQFGVDYDRIGRGSAQDLFDEQLSVRELLRAQSKTEWLIISTGMFTSFLFDSTFGVVDLAQGHVRALGSWDNAVTVTAAEDIGVLTAAILFEEPPLRNQVVYTAGDTITYRRLAETVAAVTGREIHKTVWTVDALREELAQDPTNALRKYRVVFAEGTGVAWSPEKSYNSTRNITVTDVQHWLESATKSGKA